MNFIDCDKQVSRQKRDTDTEPPECHHGRCLSNGSVWLCSYSRRKRYEGRREEAIAQAVRWNREHKDKVNARRRAARKARSEQASDQHEQEERQH